MENLREGEPTAKCVNCGEPIRRTRPGDRVDSDVYKWVHEPCNPICDLTFVASPGGDGYGPAPVVAYVIDGKRYDPADVTIVRRGAP